MYIVKYFKEQYKYVPNNRSVWRTNLRANYHIYSRENGFWSVRFCLRPAMRHNSNAEHHMVRLPIYRPRSNASQNFLFLAPAMS